MAISSFYLNAPSLETATAVWLDAKMTMLAPDGYYQSGNIVRQLSGGVLLPQQTCTSCAYPCSDYPIDGGGEEGVYKININIGSGLGAVIVKINPDAIPSGFLVEYNSVAYNEFSSVAYGYLAAVSGATYLGRAADDCGIVVGSPYLLDVYRYNGTDFPITIDQESFSVITSQIKTTANEPGDCVLVIPKLSASPSTIEISIYATCPYGAFSVEVSCPVLLQAWLGTIRYNNRFGVCDDIPTQTYYVAHVNGSGTTLGLYDWVFSDIYGQNPLANGYYATPASNGYIQVENGVIIKNSAC